MMEMMTMMYSLNISRRKKRKLIEKKIGNGEKEGVPMVPSFQKTGGHGTTLSLVP